MHDAGEHTAEEDLEGEAPDCFSMRFVDSSHPMQVPAKSRHAAVHESRDRACVRAGEPRTPGL